MGPTVEGVSDDPASSVRCDLQLRTAAVPVHSGPEPGDQCVAGRDFRYVATAMRSGALRWDVPSITAPMREPTTSPSGLMPVWRKLAMSAGLQAPMPWTGSPLI